MPLCQLRNTRVRCYTFNCQIDALEHPPLPFVRLHDLAADFLKDLFRFDIQDHPRVLCSECSAVDLLNGVLAAH